jgi:hypothetical protein
VPDLCPCILPCAAHRTDVAQRDPLGRSPTSLPGVSVWGPAQRFVCSCRQCRPWRHFLDTNVEWCEAEVGTSVDALTCLQLLSIFIFFYSIGPSGASFRGTHRTTTVASSFDYYQCPPPPCPPNSPLIILMTHPRCPHISDLLFLPYVPPRYPSATHTSNISVRSMQWSTSYSPLFAVKMRQAMSHLVPLAVGLVALHLSALTRLKDWIPSHLVMPPEPATRFRSQ